MKASLSAIINLFIFRRHILFVGIAVHLLAHQLAPQKWVDAKSKSNRCNERLYSGWNDERSVRCWYVSVCHCCNQHYMAWQEKIRDRFKNSKVCNFMLGTRCRSAGIASIPFTVLEALNVISKPPWAWNPARIVEILNDQWPRKSQWRSIFCFLLFLLQSMVHGSMFGQQW